MDFFHIVFDTCLLRVTPFGGPLFQRMIRRVQEGVAKVYVPYITLEERRTQLVDDHLALAAEMQTRLDNMKSRQLGLIIQGLPTPELFLPTREEVDRNSYLVLGNYLKENKIEVLPYTLDHADRVWERYFGNKPPFNPAEKRANRRKDIPDAWILEATLDIAQKPGRHCVLTKDGKLEAVMKDEGFEVWTDPDKLDEEIERCTAAVPLRPRAEPAGALQLDKLRGAEFDNVALLVLGINEVLGTPGKMALFDHLEKGGIRRAVAEHEARGLVLAEVLDDTGNHLIPRNKAQAEQAANEASVQEFLANLYL